METRVTTVTAILLVATLTVGAWSVTIGETRIPLPDILAALTTQADPATARIIVDWRLPRILVGLIAGAALSIGGAIFQSVTRNPLGSPDVIGFSTGAYTGALIASLVLTLSGASIAIGALLGGFATGVVMFVLAWRKGGRGYRFIIVGIGVSAILGAFNSYLLITVKVEQAISAATWGAGSLAEAGWSDVIPVGICLLVVLPFCGLLGSRMALLELGDATARSLGVRTGLSFALLVIVGITLTAIVTAVTGPIVFVALAAPQLARRLTRTPGVRLIPSAAMGALLLAICDLIARTVLAPADLPVGIVTLCLGGGYLLCLLAAGSWRTR